jgi:hypothetical protein
LQTRVRVERSRLVTISRTLGARDESERRGTPEVPSALSPTRSSVDRGALRGLHSVRVRPVSDPSSGVGATRTAWVASDRHPDEPQPAWPNPRTQPHDASDGAEPAGRDATSPPSRLRGSRRAASALSSTRRPRGLIPRAANQTRCGMGGCPEQEGESSSPHHPKAERTFAVAPRPNPRARRGAGRPPDRDDREVARPSRNSSAVTGGSGEPSRLDGVCFRRAGLGAERGDVVAVELGQVVGCHQQPPLGPHCDRASSVKSGDQPVVLGVSEHGLDHLDPSAVELLAAR